MYALEFMRQDMIESGWDPYMVHNMTDDALILIYDLQNGFVIRGATEEERKMLIGTI